ncbi:hypothetical protein [Roseospira goensis]|uniref:Uncharacterized protein n=1 Tax=Roseospira goensis TaxID=391922 RepID=A0A7W6WLK9_9PROT|nr:hypothetical protein [Roseospira goensis]MBB4287521.1 hypothetical protein [Roseospira goensis]
MGDQTRDAARRNLLIVPDNRLDDVQGDGIPATLSGGAWIAARPLSNLLDPRFIVAAESDGVDPGATRFVIDYGAVVDLRACILWGDPSRSARVRRRISLDGGPDPAEVVRDSAWQDWIPVTGPAWTLPRAHPSFGHGRIPERELRQYPQRFWHDVAPEPVLGRFEHIDIDDGGNPAGRIRLQRCWTGSGWQTSVPVEFGAEWGWEDLSEIRTLLSGRVDAEHRPRRRTMHVRIEGLPEDEALSQVYDMIGRVGISRQLYVSWDPTETMHRHRRSGLARMARLTPSQLARHDWVDSGVQFIEEVA